MGNRKLPTISRECYSVYVLMRAGYGRVKISRTLGITPQLALGRQKTLQRHGIISGGVPGGQPRRILLPDDAFLVGAETRRAALRRKSAERLAPYEARLELERVAAHQRLAAEAQRESALIAAEAEVVEAELALEYAGELQLAGV